ncbi:hypothetical protein RA086_08885 [Lactiplantibacillus sp. WILCCON 0030]|uniref:Uncharacterized protein n=1 Tax=Lactiplantibacillus brownii TaxID=3069269 RepID=A0ABU1AA15_9LACO|nr:hypothetical protein [Lactiplantibacillus brownii]MDQ7937723.1 hypothetical protein [Lactiplantibacillus brownii]
MNNQKVISNLSLAVPGIEYMTSWAIYDVADWNSVRTETVTKKMTDFVTPSTELSTRLNLDGMFVGLNCSERGVSTQKSWQNFHDTSSRSQDYKILYMLANSKYQGSYMTDLFKNIPITKSSTFAKKIKTETYHEQVQNSLDIFQKEYNIIDPKKIFCFGGLVTRLLRKEMNNGNLTIKNNVEIIQLLHYGARKSKGAFKQEQHKLV